MFRARTALRIMTECMEDGHVRKAVAEPPKSIAKTSRWRSLRLRSDWAEAQAAGRPLTI